MKKDVLVTEAATETVTTRSEEKPEQSMPQPKPTSKLQPQKKKQPQQKEKEDAHQAIVQTPFGRGLVLRTRPHDSMQEIGLLERGDDYEEAMQLLALQDRRRAASKRFSRSQPQPQSESTRMLYTPKEYPSVTPRVGDDVLCEYGRGRVTKIEDVDDANADADADANIEAADSQEPTTATTEESVPPKKPTALHKYTVVLNSWRLEGRSRVTCHFIADTSSSSSTPPPLTVVRKRTVPEMDAFEKVEYAMTQKSIAAEHFSKRKDYSSALESYARAVDAVRNVQHDATSTNELRSDLVTVLASCSNNAATCCVHLQKYAEASRFAANAAVLLDAMHAKKGSKIHGVLTKEGMSDAKIFGEWRVKSCLISATAALERGDVGAAAEVLKRAREVAAEFLELESTSKVLKSQMREVKRMSVEVAKRKKAEKNKEKRRAEAMFGGGGGKKAKTNEKNSNGVGNDSATTSKPNGAEKVAIKSGFKSNGKYSVSTTNNQDGSAANSTGPPNTKLSEGEDEAVPQTPLPPPPANSALKKGKGRKRGVTFSGGRDKVREYRTSKCASSGGNDDCNGGDDGNGDGANKKQQPWYVDHSEALLLLGVVGLTVTAAVLSMGLYRGSKK